MKSKNISNLSLREQKIRKTVSIFIYITAFLIFAFLVIAIVECCHDFEEWPTICVFIQFAISLTSFTIISLSITTLVYDGKSLKSSNKQDIIKFVLTILSITLVLAFSILLLMAFIVSTYSAVQPAPTIYVLVPVPALIWVVVDNYYVLKVGKANDNLLFKTNNRWLIINSLAGALPAFYGAFEVFVANEHFERIYENVAYPFIETTFIAICISLLIYIITIALTKQENKTKKLVVWPILTVLSLAFSIMFILKGNVNRGDDFYLSILFRLLPTLYVMSMPIAMACVNKKANQKIKQNKN